jgi:hypothetical protein
VAVFRTSDSGLGYFKQQVYGCECDGSVLRTAGLRSTGPLPLALTSRRIEEPTGLAARAPDFFEPLRFFCEVARGDAFCAIAILVSAGNPSSPTRIESSSREVAFGLAEAATKILSVRTVLLFGVPR